MVFTGNFWSQNKRKRLFLNPCQRFAYATCNSVPERWQPKKHMINFYVFRGCQIADFWVFRYVSCVVEAHDTKLIS